MPRVLFQVKRNNSRTMHSLKKKSRSFCIRKKYNYMYACVYIANSAEDVQVGCNSEFHAVRQSSDN